MIILFVMCKFADVIFCTFFYVLCGYMDSIIENGYNTSYMSVLFVALFYYKSMVERYILIDNNSPKFAGLYLQKMISYNFVRRLREGLCITTKELNEIRLCAMVSGWRNSENIKCAYLDADPIDFLCFVLALINSYPIETAMEQSGQINIDNVRNIYMIEQTPDMNVKKTYWNWHIKNKIINVPTIVIFKLTNITHNFQINKKIQLFDNSEQYCGLMWTFHCMICKNGSNDYTTIIDNGSCLVSFLPNTIPHISKLSTTDICNIKNKTIYVIYRKEPSI